mmetsp:Transcript_40381/g.119743  ORF Transcript_40381/g.119743 Transcript_40381/m.119743 type:complete len:200 (+) Transcript_40381:707-1306(+)
MSSRFSSVSESSGPRWKPIAWETWAQWRLRSAGLRSARKSGSPFSNCRSSSLILVAAFAGFVIWRSAKRPFSSCAVCQSSPNWRPTTSGSMSGSPPKRGVRIHRVCRCCWPRTSAQSRLNGSRAACASCMISKSEAPHPTRSSFRWMSTTASRWAARRRSKIPSCLRYSSALAMLPLSLNLFTLAMMPATSSSSAILLP